MNSETIIDVVKKLIGNITPVGDTYKDNEAYENQENLIELTNSCIDMLMQNTIYKDRVEYSVQRMGIKSYKALQELKNELERC